MNPLRISIVQYLNTAPLVRGFTHGPLRGKYQLSFTIPSQCAEDLRSGAADIAIIPAIEYQRIPDLVILPGLAVASKRTVRSLLLVSKKPVHQVTSIALDRTSRSTQALVRILCNKRWHIAPEFFEAEPNLEVMLERADAALLIGDPALRLAIGSATKARRGASGERLIPAGIAGIPGAGELSQLDIVEEWRAMTNLPAVLAVWAARSEIVTPELVHDFQDSLFCFGWAQMDAIALEAAAQMGLPTSELQRYLNGNIDYTLDAENLAGLAHYFKLAASLGLIDEPKPIALASELRGPVRYVEVVTNNQGGRPN